VHRVDKLLFEIAKSDRRFAYEAYEFVNEVVTYTQAQLGLLDDEVEPDDRHVNGRELLNGACDLAVQEFGFMAAIVFKHWGICSSDDFGEIIFRLIDAERLTRSESDDLADFRMQQDLLQTLDQAYELDTTAYPAGKVHL
jgi:uncharacterized repeat protein (TIGR04138 family)